LLDDYCHDIDLTPAQAHALIELENAPINGTTLAERLYLNKSNASRVLKQLHEANLVCFETEATDQRSHLARLTHSGIAKLGRLHAIYDRVTDTALSLLTPSETDDLIKALSRYKRALDQAAEQSTFAIRPISSEDDKELAAVIKAVSDEHGLAGSGYAVADANLTTLSQHYQQPKHRYWVVTKPAQNQAQSYNSLTHRALSATAPKRGMPSETKILGGAGVQALRGEPSLAELSKMYLLPEARGCGLARRLACDAIRFAQDMGYQGIYLETTASLETALALYQSLGFKQLPHHRGDTGHQSGCEIAMLLAF